MVYVDEAGTFLSYLARWLTLIASKTSPDCRTAAAFPLY